MNPLPLLKTAALLLSLPMAASGILASEEHGGNPGRAQLENVEAGGSAKERRGQNLGGLKTCLQSRGVAMNREGIQSFLQERTDPRPGRADAEKLIRQLGSDNFAERRQAGKALAQLSVPPFDLLQEATRSSDPEVVYRAKLILETTMPQRRKTVETAALAIRAIELLKLPGLAEEIFQAVELLLDGSLLATVEPALLATVVAEDFSLLDALIEKKPALRTVAIRALGANKLAGVDGVRERLDLLWNTGNPADRLASTEALLAQGSRDALERFVQLLESEDSRIRARAVGRLFTATGQALAFDPLGAPEERLEQLSAWRKWVDKEGSTIEMQKSRAFPGTWGRTLVSNYFSDSVVEYDLAGNQTWRVEREDPWACWGIETGERFVHAAGEFIAYAPGPGPARALWSIENVNRVLPLPSGGSLLWSHQNGSLMQYNRSGKLIWETRVTWQGKKRSVVDLQRLPTDRTLVAIDTIGKAGPVFGDTLLELDEDGRVIRNSPYDRKVEVLQHLPSGTTLVRLDPEHPTIGSVLQERSSSGAVVWSHDGDMILRAAQRLSNGNTLLAGNGRKAGIREIRLDGSTAWVLRPSSNSPFGISMVCRY